VTNKLIDSLKARLIHVVIPVYSGFGC